MESYSLRKITLSEFNNMKTNNDNKYELIDGIVLMSPRPNIKHQEIMSNLHYELRNLLKEKNCKVFTEVELEYKDNVIIPDISVVCGLENTNIQRYKKSPEIVIEILSPSSRYTDTFTKLYKYEMLGVKEYWIVSPDTEMITIYDFEDKANIEYSKSTKLISSVFKELEINLQDIFN